MALVSPISQYKLAAGEGLADTWWKTGRVSTKATGAQTGGSFSQIETTDPRGTATPLHIHRNEEESFYVLEGEVAVLVDGEWLELGAGDFALVPRGVPHAYVVRSERARMLVTFSPSGFEQAFADLGVATSESPEPPVETVIPLARGDRRGLRPLRLRDPRPAAGGLRAKGTNRKSTGRSPSRGSRWTRRASSGGRRPVQSAGGVAASAC